MVLGSHNTLSYLTPSKWYKRPFKWMAKCQNISYYKQYDLGVKVFDLRIKFNKYGDTIICHGKMEYEFDICDLHEFLTYLNRCKDCYLRVIYEVTSSKSEYKEEYFKNFCIHLQNTYKNIVFFGGNRKYDWKQIFKFCTEEKAPKLIDRYSSTTSIFKSDNKFLRIIDDLWPWLYAKLNNHKNYNAYKDTKDCLFIDFVDMK